MKLKNIEVGEEYAYGEIFSKKRGRVLAIKRVEKTNRWGRIVMSSNRKVVMRCLDRETGEPIEDDEDSSRSQEQKAVPAQKVKKLWTEHVEEKRKEKERRAREREERKARREESLKLQRQITKKLKEDVTRNIKMNIGHSGRGTVSMSYEKLAELIDV